MCLHIPPERDVSGAVFTSIDSSCEAGQSFCPILSQLIKAVDFSLIISLHTTSHSCVFQPLQIHRDMNSLQFFATSAEGAMVYSLSERLCCAKIFPKLSSIRLISLNITTYL